MFYFVKVALILKKVGDPCATQYTSLVTVTFLSLSSSVKTGIGILKAAGANRIMKLAVYTGYDVRTHPAVCALFKEAFKS